MTFSFNPFYTDFSHPFNKTSRKELQNTITIRTSLFKISCESIFLSAQCTKTNVKVAYIHNSWSTYNSVELEIFLCVNGSCHRPFDQSMHANSRGSAINSDITSLTLCTIMALSYAIHSPQLWTKTLNWGSKIV
jgi:hypothetical protein